MSITSTIINGLTRSYQDSVDAAVEIGEGLSEEEFWTKPYPYGNSIGHLVLHVTGNLSYYIGAVIAETGYVRDRPREFTEPNPPPKEEALRRLRDAVDIVVATLRSQTDESWSLLYTADNAPDIVDTRFDMFLRCATHFEHHVGEMVYMKREWRIEERGARESI